MISKSQPTSRRGSSSRPGHPQQQQPPARTRSSVSFGETGLRRQSTQERIGQILDVSSSLFCPVLSLSKHTIPRPGPL